MRMLHLEPRAIERRRPIREVEPLPNDAFAAVVDREAVERRCSIFQSRGRRQPVVIPHAHILELVPAHRVRRIDQLPTIDVQHVKGDEHQSTGTASTPGLSTRARTETAPTRLVTACHRFKPRSSRGLTTSCVSDGFLRLSIGLQVLATADDHFREQHPQNATANDPHRDPSREPKVVVLWSRGESIDHQDNRHRQNASHERTDCAVKYTRSRVALGHLILLGKTEG